MKKNARPDIRSMEVFAAVVSCGSMTAAAQMLSVSQPAVTRMVRDLETRVGFSLFERNGPKIAPTEKGMKFFEESQRVMANLTQLTMRAHAIRDEKIAAIDIVATPTMSAGLVAPVLSRIADVLPDFVHVETISAERVIHALRQRTADLGISAFPIDHDRLRCLARFESSLVAVVQEGSPFDRPGPLPLAVFAEERLATISNSYRIRRAINQAFDENKVVPAREIATNSSLNAAMAARSGLGIAICDPVTALGVPVRGVKIRMLSEQIKYDWGLFANDENGMKDQLDLVTEAFAKESELIIKRISYLVT
ncbi:LysR family transcriptional regulator [Ruegeria hyattellae]|uniref:LysR family transcriptional regulator n=1 Tax=Ruegeria hyattellae TaxID=3233337 RepID=UPI00355AE335